jgi:murein tripeptide amidase MpaA
MSLRLARTAGVGVLVYLFSIALSPQKAPQYLVQIETNDAQTLGHQMEESGFDVASISESKKMIQVVTADPQRIMRFAKDFGIDSTAFRVSSIERSQPYEREVDATEEDYFDYPKTLARLNQLADQNRDIVRTFNLTNWLNQPKTQEGRDIFALQISKNPDQIEDEPKILFIGQHHARELMTHHTVLDTAAFLLEQVRAGNNQYADAVEKSAIWFVPVVNPDGLEFVFDSDRMWRKNRSANSDGSRGVDINRNYPFKWGECGQNSSYPESDIFKGPNPGSEPEVKLMDALVNRLRFQYIISYHSSGNEVLYPYRCGELAEAQMINDIRDRLANELNFGQRVGSSSGEDYEHHYAYYGAIAFLLEIGEEFQPPYSEYENVVFPNVRKVLPFLLNELEAPHLLLKVTDAGTDQPVQAKLEIAQIRFKEGETRTTDSFGTYRWRLAPGAYQVSVSAPGFRAQTLTVDFPSQSVAKNIRLERSR